MHAYSFMRVVLSIVQMPLWIICLHAIFDHCAVQETYKYILTPPSNFFCCSNAIDTFFFCFSICCLFRLVRRTVEWSRIGTQMVPGISVRSSNAYSCVYVFVTSFVFLLYTLSMHIFRFIWIIRRSMLRTRTVSRVCMCMHRVHYYILLLYDMCIDHLRS
jgi:hypothetical protein